MENQLLDPLGYYLIKNEREKKTFGIIHSQKILSTFGASLLIKEVIVSKNGGKIKIQVIKDRQVMKIFGGIYFLLYLIMALKEKALFSFPFLIFFLIFLVCFYFILFSIVSSTVKKDFHEIKN